MKIVALLFSLFVLLWGGHQLYQKQTQFGLKAKFASPTFSPSPEWELPPLSSHEQVQVDAILFQPFTFLARGSQAFAFISEDQRYVLKLFKQHKWRPSHLLSYLPLSFNPYYKAYLLKQKKQHDVLHSCKTALFHVKEDTGVLYAHLNPTPLNVPPVTLIDKHGKLWKIDLSKSCFLLQKKADLFYEHIADLMNQMRVEEAKHAITSSIKLIDRFIDLGVYENNAILRKNFGFINNEAMQFDIGKFKFDPSRVRDKREIRTVTKNFRKWVITHYPELQVHFDQTLDLYSPLEPAT
jgi:hypothetical protein